MDASFQSAGTDKNVQVIIVLARQTERQRDRETDRETFMVPRLLYALCIWLLAAQLFVPPATKHIGSKSNSRSCEE